MANPGPQGFPDIDPCHCYAATDEFPMLDLEWQTMEIYTQLVELLTKNAKNMKRDDRIICFGLGRLQLWHKMVGVHRGRAYMQHAAAMTIRDVFSNHQDRAGVGNIEIFAQDPGYCLNCKEYLKHPLGIIVVDDPFGYPLVNENTFVVTASPGVDVARYTSDRLRNTAKGLAGMLCDPIGPSALGGYVATPTLLAWKEKCIEKGYLLDDSNNQMASADQSWPIIYRQVFNEIGLYLRAKEEN